MVLFKAVELFTLAQLEDALGYKAGAFLSGFPPPSGTVTKGNETQPGWALADLPKNARSRLSVRREIFGNIGLIFLTDAALLRFEPLLVTTRIYRSGEEDFQ